MSDAIGNKDAERAPQFAEELDSLGGHGGAHDIVPAGFFEFIPSEYREAAARGDFHSVDPNYYRAAVKEWKRWQREARRRFNETYKVERTGTFYTFIAPCCVKKTITVERCRLVSRSKSA